jgi:hypothetical protein
MTRCGIYSWTLRAGDKPALWPSFDGGNSTGKVLARCNEKQSRQWLVERAALAFPVAGPSASVEQLLAIVRVPCKNRRPLSVRWNRYHPAANGDVTRADAKEGCGEGTSANGRGHLAP